MCSELHFARSPAWVYISYRLTLNDTVRLDEVRTEAECVDVGATGGGGKEEEEAERLEGYLAIRHRGWHLSGSRRCLSLCPVSFLHSGSVLRMCAHAAPCSTTAGPRNTDFSCVCLEVSSHLPFCWSNHQNLRQRVSRPPPPTPHPPPPPCKACRRTKLPQMA